MAGVFLTEKKKGKSVSISLIATRRRGSGSVITRLMAAMRRGSGKRGLDGEEV